MSGVPITYRLIERLLKEYPKTVIGMKDSSGDFDNMSGAAKEFPGFAVLSGSDEFLLPLLKPPPMPPLLFSVLRLLLLVLVMPRPLPV